MKIAPPPKWRPGCVPGYRWIISSRRGESRGSDRPP